MPAPLRAVWPVLDELAAPLLPLAGLLLLAGLDPVRLVPAVVLAVPAAVFAVPAPAFAELGPAVASVPVWSIGVQLRNIMYC